MLRNTLVELIEPMLNSAGADRLALYIHTRTPAWDDRLPCLKNPRPEGAESSLTERASSPFQAEPAQSEHRATFPLLVDKEVGTYYLVHPEFNAPEEVDLRFEDTYLATGVFTCGWGVFLANLR